MNSKLDKLTKDMITLYKNSLMGIQKNAQERNRAIELANDKIKLQNDKKNKKLNFTYHAIKQKLEEPTKKASRRTGFRACSFCWFESRYILPIFENVHQVEEWGEKFGEATHHICLNCITTKRDSLTEEHMKKEEEKEEKAALLEERKEKAKIEYAKKRKKTANKLAKERAKEKDKVKSK